jgi:tetratricopeptide (TPR) repeat protein
VTDFAGVIDVETKTRLDNLLQRLKDRSKIDFYVTTVESTGAQEISLFSQQLARDWDIGAKSSRNKSLLLVISVASKTSFTQFTRMVQPDLPDGVLGEMSYRMQGPLSEGRFAEAVNNGVRVFVNALAEKIGFNVSELEETVVAMKSPELTDLPQPTLVNIADLQTTRPRVVKDVSKEKAEATPPAESQVDPEPAPSESPKKEPTPAETVTTEAQPVESPKNEPETTTDRRAGGTTRVRSAPKKTAAEIAEQDADESEEVELTLTLPLAKRAVALKEFLDTHPESKARPRANELLISTHAALGDQKLKNSDIGGGIEQLFLAINEADVDITDQLFSGVISQIPMNLYLRGEKEAAFKAAQTVEAKFGADPKRLLAVAGFYLGVERAGEAVRIAETVVKLAPDFAEAHRILAVSLHISLRLDEAIEEYKKTLQLDPSSNVSRVSLADLYRATGRMEDALTLYNEQLALDPKDKAAHAGKVVTLFELGRSDEANSELEAALASEPNNLPLLAGTAYWLAARDNNERALELALKAVGIEPRYTWAQIALARSLLKLQRPLDAERALRFARQYGKFPTLSYELATVLSSMGLYDEAVEILRESFTIRDGQIHAYLAGHVPASGSGFIELLAPERRAGIYQPTSADTATNAYLLKALLEFNAAITLTTEGEKIDERAAVKAAQEFAYGTDSMSAFRQTYAASRLLRNGVGIDAALDLIAEARKASDEALKVPVVTMAVQADEFRELRARAIAGGNVPGVADAPQEVLANILKGRLQDLYGWALFNQEKYSEAITHLTQATETLPQETPAWRTALWHLGVALEQTGQKEQALQAYIKSYSGGPVESVRRSVIEQLYRNIYGSLEGLDESIVTGTIVGDAKAKSDSAETPGVEPATPEPAPAETPKPETATAPTTEPLSEDSLKNAASRLRSNIKITGRIVDADKVGISNVVVVLISPSGAVMASTTDNEGNYSFTVAPSQKTYRVIPSKEGYTFSPIDRAFPGLFEDLKEIDFVGSRN